MVATVAAGTSARYYTSQAEYSLGGKEPDGGWIAAGAGLGVSVPAGVDRETFERLHAASDVAGRPLIANSGKHLDQVGGYDVTFSAPKSLLVLWGLSGRTASRRT